MQEDTLLSEIHELVEGKDFARLKSTIGAMEVHDLTALLGELDGDDVAVVFRFLGRELAADVFGDLEIEQQEELLVTLSSETVAGILNDMPPDERTELLEELPGSLAQRLMSGLRGDELRVARSLLAYPEDSVGRLMTPEYVAIRPDWTVDDVFAHIRKVAPAKETLNVIYVVDEDGKLLDEITLEGLVLADHSDAVRDLMDRQVATLQATDDREAALDDFKKYEAVALPVVDSQGALVGMVTVDDAMDVAEEEYSEDVQKMAGMGALEYSYFGTGMAGMLGKRLPWLVLLLAAQMLTVLALTNFLENFKYVTEFAVLVLFMPLINSTAGNTGSQAAVLMTRGFAVQEMDLGDWTRVLLHEVTRGLIMGLVLGVAGYGTVVLFGRGGQVALAVGLSIVTAVTLANLIGSMLPFLFKRIGLDPAVTSGPFLASLMDLSGIVIYFSIAVAIFRLLA